MVEWNQRGIDGGASWATWGVLEDEKVGDHAVISRLLLFDKGEAYNSQAIAVSSVL